MRGRIPEPIANKIAKGERESRINRNAPDPDKLTPKCPSWLDSDAKKKWKELVPLLEKMGVLTLVDGDALASYCQAWAEFKQATETLKKEGRYVERGTGGLTSHPAVAQQRTAWKAVKDFAALFGMDPANRGRINVNKQTPSTSKSRFFKTVG